MFYILIVLFMAPFAAVSQNRVSSQSFALKGSVEMKDTAAPISGVLVTASLGGQTFTNAFGQFELNVTIGEQLRIQDARFETVNLLIKTKDEILVQVESEDYSEKDNVIAKVSRSGPSLHQVYLDSAIAYKKTDIVKSTDFVAQSINQLGKRGNDKELAKSLSTLGEIYLFHKQYDFAIEKFKDALKSNKTIATTLLLGRAYVLVKEFKKAEEALSPLKELKNMLPYQRVTLYELLGDVKKGEGTITIAVSYYNEGLTVATKNQITTKMTDLTSKIADAYAQGNQLVEAETYYGNSLELASKLAPKRALEEKEKVADFYNKKSQFDEEIALRKNSLATLEELNGPRAPKRQDLGDTLTTQRINYKIANAYISQDKFNEAIPFLERSIVEAGTDDDLLVQKDATRKLSEVYEYTGDFNKALESYQDYVALVDTLYIRKEQEISRAARFNREIASTQNRIASLEQERELSESRYDLALTQKELSEESYKNQRWIIYSLIFGLVLMALAAFFFYRSNQQQKLSNNLLALRSLRSQMNPHFIFNALNSVNNFIAKSDERSANRYLSDFSTLMRSVLENSEQDYIPLSKELNLLELYIKLEHSRFPDKFDYKITIDEALDIPSFQIPPMLLQPYIENAIWHGLRYKDEKGLLEVQMVSKGDNEVEIAISDDGIGRKKSAELKTQHQKKQRSKGMGNIKQRVSILNDMHKDKVAIQILDLTKEGTGTKVVFTLKKEV